MEIFLQCWGGTGYLLHKILIARSESLENDKHWRLFGWISYLLGMPAFLIVLVSNQNWIASSIEIAGIPSIVLGIFITLKKNNNPSKYIDWAIRIFTGIMILLGVLFSIYTYSGLKMLSQILEMIIIIGILIGNYLLAKKNPFAWIMLMVGLISSGILMYIQDNIILCMYQLFSLIPVMIGFIICSKRFKKI